MTAAAKRPMTSAKPGAQQPGAMRISGPIADQVGWPERDHP
jgi:hypothetical protein